MAQVVQTCYRHSDQRAGVVCQRCDRPICPQCMHQASVGFHCPECAKTGKQRVYDARAIATMGSTVTRILIGVNLAVFVLGVILEPSGFFNGSQRLLVDGGLISGGRLQSGQLIGVAHGQWWRLVTSGFLHYGALHIAFNMYALWVLGPLIERAVGRVAFVVIYGSSLLAGSLGGLLLTPYALGAGASGAIFGLMGAALAAQKANHVRLAEGGILMWVGINLVITFALPGISKGGHIGGLIGGAIAGACVFYGPRYAKDDKLPTVLAGLVGVVSVAGALIVAAAHP